MCRSILLERKPKQMKYHRLENVKLIQRKEDDNTIIQGEHCVYVLEKFESFIWERCDGSHTVVAIAEALSKSLGLDMSDLLSEICDFLQKLKEEELIELL